MMMTALSSTDANQTPFQSIPNFFDISRSLGMPPQILNPCSDGAKSQNECKASQPMSTAKPEMLLTYLSFLEHKIGHLRTIVNFNTNHQLHQQQLVSTELNCIIFQLISISENLVPPNQNMRHPINQEIKSPSPDGTDSDPMEEVDMDDEDNLNPGSYEILQLEKEEILAHNTHYCSICGKAFKRDANLRMHMRGHGNEYKTMASLAKPGKDSWSGQTIKRYSCPFIGCKRNKEHKSFQPLKSALCVKNHYKRSHCDKSYTCSRCHVKKFSVIADLRTHEKHCGRDRWVCSCGSTFSRKDKLFAHVLVFEGHTPALSAEEDSVHSTSNAEQRNSNEAVKMSNGERIFSDSTSDSTRDSDIKGVENGHGNSALVRLDSFNFDGFDLFGAPAMGF